MPRFYTGGGGNQTTQILQRYTRQCGRTETIAQALKHNEKHKLYSKNVIHPVPMRFLIATLHILWLPDGALNEVPREAAHRGGASSRGGVGCSSKVF
jgi:hypothetical protein